MVNNYVGNKYDMCVDCETLCSIEDKLKIVNRALEESAKEMLAGLNESQGFLAGMQFEKAKAATLKCIDVSARAVNNINNALEYIKVLKEKLEDYSKCSYTED